MCLLSLPLTNVSTAFVQAAGHSPTGKIKVSSFHPVQPSGNTDIGKHSHTLPVLNYTRGAYRIRNRNRTQEGKEKDQTQSMFGKTWLEMPRSRWQCLNRMCVEGLRGLFHPCQGEC